MNDDGCAECPYTDCGDCPFAEDGGIGRVEDDESERIMDEKEYTMFFKNGDKYEPLGVPQPITMDCAKLEVHEHPRERKYVETKLVYSEGTGDYSRTLEIETFMTAKMMQKIIRDLMGGDAS